jgi:hypothetical protein
VVKALCFDRYANSDLFAVGTPGLGAVRVYRYWPELFDELAERHAVKIVELARNHRCVTEIIKIAKRMRDDRRPIAGDRLAVWCRPPTTPMAWLASNYGWSPRCGTLTRPGWSARECNNTLSVNGRLQSAGMWRRRAGTSGSVATSPPVETPLVGRGSGRAEGPIERPVALSRPALTLRWSRRSSVCGGTTTSAR